MRYTLLPHVFIVSGAGVGGGSLVYACTLYQPPDVFFEDSSWTDVRKDWKDELDSHYRSAERMLGVVDAPRLEPGDRVLQDVARDLGREETFRPTRVGIFFGEPGVTVPDPYFGGEGPARTGCTFCGGCMVGCRHGAKNTLDKNYLWFAEKRGVRIFPETRAIDVRPPSTRRIRGHGPAQRGLGPQESAPDPQPRRRLFGRSARHQQAALELQAQWLAPTDFRPARAARADQQRVDPRSDRQGRRR